MTAPALRGTLDYDSPVFINSIGEMHAKMWCSSCIDKIYRSQYIQYMMASIRLPRELEAEARLTGMVRASEIMMKNSTYCPLCKTNTRWVPDKFYGKF